MKVGFQKTCKNCKNKPKKRCKFTQGKRQVKKALKISIWECLGLHLGGLGRGFGRDLEPLGVSWAVFWAHFFMLVFGVVSTSAPGGFLAGSWIDFGRVGRDFGRVLEGIFDGFSFFF